MYVSYFYLYSLLFFVPTKTTYSLAFTFVLTQSNTMPNS